ncbi:MAG: glycine--tRNA ligase subunit beta [Clostridiales bacterium]|jgi:glycyl-tRNA synthetase beta chain|nr:glycine--tRNA ligase subunit beta [Clostridiales bacterium]MDR2712421.1 glycine--tRNA ligase subunit beta [Clostridiales bacterium]
MNNNDSINQAFINEAANDSGNNKNPEKPELDESFIRDSFAQETLHSDELYPNDIIRQDFIVDGDEEEKVKSPPSHYPFLLEIGTEEIPARFLSPLLEQFEKLACQSLAEQKLVHGPLQVLATPRRLVLLINGLAALQPDSEQEQKGPARKSAYDGSGQPTRALLGFCQSQGVKPEDLREKEQNGNIYLFAKKKIPGKATAAILPQLINSVIEKISFPKPMRWGYEDFRFARPIRWLLCLFGEEIIPISIAGVQSANISRGHRSLGSQEIQINDPKNYLEKLAKNYCIVDQKQRSALIWQQIASLAQEAQGQVKEDPELLEEITFLLEYPTALMGNFDPAYLNMPQELVITPMREHQRYFPVYDEAGSLLPKFIAVRNGDNSHLEIVTAGNEKVLNARLADAQFFWLEDLKQPLDSFLPSLTRTIFHQKLGSLASRVERIKELALSIGQEMAFSGDNLRQIARAATLAKADLSSHVVYEFPELQGIMGQYYAEKAQEDPEVAIGIREHYLPRFAGDALPQSRTGLAVALADKIDSVVGFFAIGLLPSGSQDPYALRRAAAGIVQIILEHQLDLNMPFLLNKAYQLYIEQGIEFSKSREEATGEVLVFLRQRLANILSEQAIAYDTINAALAVDFSNIYRVWQRAQVLEKYRSSEGFIELATGFTRASNLCRNSITKQNFDPNEACLRPELLQEPSEKALYEKLVETEGKVGEALTKYAYDSALETVAALRGVIDGFFNEVLVMDENRDLRHNRLALLQRIVNLLENIADLTEVRG